MSSALAEALTGLVRLRKEIKALTSTQIFSKDVQRHLHAVATNYFSVTRPELVSIGGPDLALAEADELFRQLLSASRKNGSKAKCLQTMADARAALLAAEESLVARDPPAKASIPASDIRIVETLADVCPTASASYQQALLDLQIDRRASWRGTAAELRESLRETLDTLAPDADVQSAPGFKLEPDAKRPTMKQKARFILRSRGRASGQLEVPETAIEGIESAVGGLVRSVYTRSSVSTHVVTNKDEVLRVLAWVRLVMCELLELPL